MRLLSLIAAPALCAGLILAAPAVAQESFDTFWRSFTAAAKANDRAAIRSMMDYPSPALGKENTAQEFDALYESLFADDLRGCLATTKPMKDELNQYSAFCEEDIYVFGEKDGVWKLTDVGVND